MNFIKEACVESFEGAVAAEKNGADRIEICSNLELDGLTPSREIVRELIETLNIPIKVMIRPKAGDFCYNKQEIKEMFDDIAYFKSLGVYGVVLGVLNDNNTVDINLTNKLVKVAGKLEVTFHKAIDLTNDIFKGLETLSRINQIKSILTSGASSTAEGGLVVIRKIVQKFQSRFNIFACGKITKDNLINLHDRIGAKFYHGRRIVG